MVVIKIKSTNKNIEKNIKFEFSLNIDSPIMMVCHDYIKIIRYNWNYISTGVIFIMKKSHEKNEMQIISMT